MEAKRYNLVFYNVKQLNNFVFGLLESSGKNISQVQFAYIYHDKDIIEETGEIKKPHYHLWLEFPQPVRDTHIINHLELVGLNASALSYQKTDRNFLAYLTHDTKNSKEVKVMYDYLDIQTNIDKDIFNEMYFEAVRNTTKPSKSELRKKERVELFGKLFDIVKDNNEIVSVSSMINFLRENKEYELIDYYLTRSYAVVNALKGIFEDNVLAYYKSQVEFEEIKEIGVSNNEKSSSKCKRQRLS